MVFSGAIEDMERSYNPQIFITKNKVSPHSDNAPVNRISYPGFTPPILSDVRVAHAKNSERGYLGGTRGRG